MEIADPSFDYNKYGHTYSGSRQTDPRIARYINEAMEGANTILNVGAGTGSYEPEGKYVIALEPSEVMRTQRIAAGKLPAVIGNAAKLPFDTKSFDASMAVLTVHHWPDMRQGLQEMRRVTRGPVLIMTFDPDALDHFWNTDYFPMLIEVECSRYPTIGFLKDCLGGNCEIKSIPIPFDCVDGFQEAFYGRPEAFLEKKVRLSQSAWGFLPEGIEDKYVTTLKNELSSGEWDRKYGIHRSMPSFTCALRLIVAYP